MAKRIDLTDTRNPDARMITKMLRAATGWTNIDARYQFQNITEEDKMLLLLEARQWEHGVEQAASDRLADFMRKTGVKVGGAAAVPSAKKK